LSRRWLTERKGDPYHRWAKEQGYRSRAAFKLKQLDERFHLFSRARYVLDIGAAPGGWLQVASEAVGDRGLVVGVDLNEIEALELDNVVTVVGDVLEEETLMEIMSLFPGKVDVVLSDLAPKVSGAWDMDHFRQVELAKVALEIAKRLLKRRGWFVVKVFQGSESDAYIREVRRAFRDIHIVKPQASRKGSAEIYLVAKDMK
jgi:23S rRNA (uridine2552-2'-O)-methyltransferase